MSTKASMHARPEITRATDNCYQLIDQLGPALHSHSHQTLWTRQAPGVASPKQCAHDGEVLPVRRVCWRSRAAKAACRVPS